MSCRWSHTGGMSLTGDPRRARDQSRHRQVVYWAATAVIVAECFGGGIYDLFRLRPFFPMLAQLGYPAYLSPMLAVAKFLAGTALLVPGFQRLKEWAYAGIMINMLGATVSWLAISHGPSDFVPPLAFAVITFVSWAARPAYRRLPSDSSLPSFTSAVRRVLHRSQPAQGDARYPP